MIRPRTPLPVGTRVRTRDPLDPDVEEDLLVEPWHRAARRPGASGRISGVVPLHGGDIYLIDHGHGGDPGAYCYTEIEIEREISEDDDMRAAPLAA